MNMGNLLSLWINRHTVDSIICTYDQQADGSKSFTYQIEILLKQSDMNLNDAERSS